MVRERGYITFIIAILLLTLPSAASLAYYYMTKNPWFRPLGITKETLQAFSGGSGSGEEVVAIVNWDSTRAGQVTQRDMYNVLAGAFGAKGVDVRVTFTPSTSGTFVTYKIGSSTIGPYPQGRAAEGIIAAVAAYRMSVSFEP